jgi:hypothetical protein
MAKGGARPGARRRAGSESAALSELASLQLDELWLSTLGQECTQELQGVYLSDFDLKTLSEQKHVRAGGNLPGRA